MIASVSKHMVASKVRHGKNEVEVADNEYPGLLKSQETGILSDGQRQQDRAVLISIVQTNASSVPR
jgi:hypothetical protein